MKRKRKDLDVFWVQNKNTRSNEILRRAYSARVRSWNLIQCETSALTVRSVYAPRSSAAPLGFFCQDNIFWTQNEEVHRSNPPPQLSFLMYCCQKTIDVKNARQWRGYQDIGVFQLFPFLISWPISCWWFWLYQRTLSSPRSTRRRGRSAWTFTRIVRFGLLLVNAKRILSIWGQIVASHATDASKSRKPLFGLPSGIILTHLDLLLYSSSTKICPCCFWSWYESLY